MTAAQAGMVSSPDKATLAAYALLKEVGVEKFTAADFHQGKLQHIVLFQFKKNTSDADRQEVMQRFQALEASSQRPDGKAVIVSIEAGSQNSGEDAGMGMEQGYIVTFNSEGDRNYYVGRPLVNDPVFYDPAHDRFKSFAGQFLEKVIVFDFNVTKA